MAGYEPPPAEIILVPPLMRLLLGWYYARRVRRLGLRGDESVLDFGTGPGVAALHIARALSKGGGRLTCVDISQGWMVAAKRTVRRYDNVEFRLGEIGTLDLEENACDVAFIHFVLHDVSRSDRPKAIHHLARVLKPGGRIVLREPTGKDHGIPPQEIRSLMAKAGLHEVRSQNRRLLLIQPVHDAIYHKPK